jgi:hypothetical protein
MAKSCLPLGGSRQMKGVFLGTPGGALPPFTPTAPHNRQPSGQIGMFEGAGTKLVKLQARRKAHTAHSAHRATLPQHALLCTLPACLPACFLCCVPPFLPEIAFTPSSTRIGTAARVRPGTSRWLIVTLGGRPKARSTSCVMRTPNCNRWDASHRLSVNSGQCQCLRVGYGAWTTTA